MLAQSRKIQVFEECLQGHMVRQAEDLDRPSSFFVRMRQIIEHSELTKVASSPKHLYMLSLLKKVWLVEVFEQILQSFQVEYYQSNVDITSVRQKVAHRYLYQLFQMNQFMKQGYRNLGMPKQAEQCRLGDLLRSSDEALFQSLESITAKRQFNRRDELLEEYSLIQDYCRYKYDLLKNFPAKSLEFGVFANRQYLYQDLIYIIERAEQQFENFKQDMQDICGSKISCRLKIRRQSNNSYNLNGLRKLLSRWLVNLITNDKQVIQSKAYQAFFHNKRKVLDMFYINSTVHSQSAQEQIIENMLELLTNSVYEGSRINAEFGLYIYDLLKAKLKLNTIRHIDHLLEKIQTRQNTKSTMEVFRVENRLLKHHRDVLINVKYGGFVTGEIQLLLAFSGSQQNVKQKRMEFEHKKFLYNLSRSIFGPTIELLIIYEGERRMDNAARMYSIGKVTRRTDPLKGIDFTQMFCPSKHRLLNICRQNNQLPIGDELCRQCFELVRSSTLLLCHQCNMIYCEACMKYFEQKGIKMIKNQSSMVQNLSDLAQLDKLSGYSLLMLHLEYSPASRLMHRYLHFIGSHLHHRGLNFYTANMETAKYANAFALRYQIKRFPAFLVMVNGMPSKILVGASIFKLLDLINIMRSENLQKRCPHNHEMVEARLRSYVNWICSECSRPRNNSDSTVMCCKECMYQCCRKCSFGIEVAQDDRGISYLSTAIARDGFNYCRKSHKMVLAHRNPFAKIEYQCEKCNSEFFFMGEFGMYWCQHCLTMLCNNCSDQQLLGLLHTRQLANHDLNRYMMDYPVCSLCRDHYKMKSQLDLQEFWCCDICRKELQQGRQFLECQNCEVLVCENCFDKLKDDVLSKNLLADLQCACQRKLRQAAQLKQTNGRLFGCTVCHQSYYYNTLHYECEEYGKDCLFVLCSECARSTRLHVKVHCFKQNFSRDSKVRSFNLNVPKRMLLRELKGFMEQQGLIAKGCTGRFKTKQGWFSSNISEENKLEEFGTRVELYYFESFDIYDLTVAVDIFERSAATKKNRQRRKSFESFNRLRTIKPGEIEPLESPNLLQLLPEMSPRSRGSGVTAHRAILLPTLEDETASKQECCKVQKCSLM